MAKESISFEVVRHTNEQPHRQYVLRAKHNKVCMEARRFGSIIDCLEGADNYVEYLMEKGVEPRGKKVTITINYE